MSKGKGRVPMSVPLMEKEIRRLTMLGQRVEAEANLRWILLAAVMRRRGSEITLAPDEINALRAAFTEGKASLRVTQSGDSGITLVFSEPGKTAADKPIEQVLEALDEATKRAETAEAAEARAVAVVSLERLDRVLREYPDADVSKLAVSADEALRVEDRLRDMQKSRRRWIDAISYGLGVEVQGTADEVGEAVAKLRRDLAEARAQLAALHAAARDTFDGPTGWGGPATEPLKSAFADTATAAHEHEARVRAPIEAERDQLRAAGDALVEAWDGDPIGRIDGEIVEPFRRNAPAAEVPR